jgi:hypothetical protein
MIEQLAALFAPWQSLYSDSAVVSTTITSLHIVSMLIGGGLAIAADRTTLRGRADDIKDVHRIVLLALVVMFISGVLMAAADFEAFAASKIFWLKLALVLFLVINGAMLQRKTARRRFHARASQLLWTATAIVGVVLTNV